jgi:hypothetical protein
MKPNGLEGCQLRSKPRGAGRKLKFGKVLFDGFGLSRFHVFTFREYTSIFRLTLRQWLTQFWYSDKMVGWFIFAKVSYTSREWRS